MRKEIVTQDTLKTSTNAKRKTCELSVQLVILQRE